MRRSTKATAATVAAAAVVTALWRLQARSRRAEPAPGPVSHRSTVARNARLATVGARAGSSYAAHRARRVFASSERREMLDTRFEIRTAEQVADALGQMKGALMKLGQMVSYLDQGLPDHVREALAQLQQDAPPMSAELCAGVVLDELGKEPTDLFEVWDPVPIAAASIGQVHRAITREGRAVAVKVQYPGVAEAVASDLDSVGLVFAGMGQLFPGLEHKPIVAELRERLIEELDYANEARNQTRFAAHYADHPFIHVPAVLPGYSTTRVLTTELAEGHSWNELLAWSHEERNLAAETLYRFAFGSLYHLRAFNGDPHPGNYLFRPGGKVTFLDFGLVKHFTTDELDQFRRMIDSIVIHPDPAAFRRTVTEIGLLPAGPTADGRTFTDDEVTDYLGHFYEFILHDGEYTITPEYASETVRRFFDQRGPYGDIMRAANLPPSFVVINRINLGLYALFGDLHATGNWRALAEEIWPWRNGPPSTPMGEQIARWQASRQGVAAGRS